MRYYIGIGMMLMQNPLGTPSNVSPILCQTSKHLQDALLTKSEDQFIEVHKSQFLQILENLI